MNEIFIKETSGIIDFYNNIPYLHKGTAGGTKIKIVPAKTCVLYLESLTMGEYIVARNGQCIIPQKFNNAEQINIQLIKKVSDCNTISSNKLLLTFW